MAEPIIKRYTAEVMLNKPVGYWRMEEASGPFIDFVGIVGNLVVSGTPTYNSKPLVIGGSSATFTGTSYASTTVDSIFMKDLEAQPFTLELWFRTTTPTGDRLLMGRAASGLFLTTRGIEFRVTNDLGTVSTVSYAVADWNKTYHVVVTYGDHKIYLYVNGVQIGGTEFTSKFGNTSTAFYLAGSGATNPSIRIDEVAIYRRSLVSVSAQRHYSFGLRTTDYVQFLGSSTGIYYGLSDDDAKVAMTYVEDTDEDFSTGTLTNILIANGRMGVSDVATIGTRVTPPIDLDQFGSIDGTRIDWDSSNSSIIVETSLDLGNTWSAATNHTAITGLVGPMSTVNMFLQIRITFPVVDQTLYSELFERLKIVIYSEKDVTTAVSNIPAAVSTTVNLAQSDYNSLNEESVGAKLNAGRVVIPTPSELWSVAAIEMWVRRDTLTGAVGYIFDSRTAGTAYMRFDASNVYASAGLSSVYINGVLKTPVVGDFPVGQWMHVVAIPTTPFNGPVAFGGRYDGDIETARVSLAHVSLYGSALTAAQAAQHYQVGYSEEALSLLDTNNVGVAEYQTKIYSLAWGTKA